MRSRLIHASSSKSGSLHCFSKFRVTSAASSQHLIMARTNWPIWRELEVSRRAVLMLVMSVCTSCLQLERSSALVREAVSFWEKGASTWSWRYISRPWSALAARELRLQTLRLTFEIMASLMLLLKWLMWLGIYEFICLISISY